MTKSAFIYGGLVLIIFISLYPGYMLSTALISAVDKRKPTIKERLLAIVPYFNISLVDTTVTGHSMRIVVAGIASIASILLRYVLYLTDGAMILSLVSLLEVWIVLIFSWVLQGVILSKTVAILDMPGYIKVISFVFPPFAMFLIGKDCAISIHQIEEDILREEVEGV